MKVQIRLPIRYTIEEREVGDHIKKKGFPYTVHFFTNPESKQQTIQYTMEVLDKSEANSLLDFMRSKRYDYLYPLDITQSRMSFWVDESKEDIIDIEVNK